MYYKAYKIIDRPTDGTVGQDCGVFQLHELPERLQKAITDDPTAGEWVLPALEDGDSGNQLWDLEVVITGGFIDHRGQFATMSDGGCE
jgi:hypothetical protein